MVDLSIIIPTFNCQKYIVECVESIIKQIKIISINIEVIIIDDCSTDDTLKKIEKYKNYKYIKTIELTKNKGVSYARNIGLKNSSGKYILFLDSDDMLVNCGLKKIEKYILNTDYDIVKFSYRKIYKKISISKYKLKLKGEFSIKENYNNIFERFIKSYDFSPIWGQLILAKHAKKINFDTKLIVAEDLKYNMELYFKVHKIYIDNNAIIRYRVNNSSITHNINEEKVLQKIFSIYDSYHELYKYDKTGIFKKEIDCRIVDEIVASIVKIYERDIRQFKRIYTKFQSKISSDIEELNDINYIERRCSDILKKERFNIKYIIKKLINK